MPSDNFSAAADIKLWTNPHRGRLAPFIRCTTSCDVRLGGKVAQDVSIEFNLDWLPCNTLVSGVKCFGLRAHTHTLNLINLCSQGFEIHFCCVFSGPHSYWCFLLISPSMRLIKNGRKFIMVDHHFYFLFSYLIITPLPSRWIFCSRKNKKNGKSNSSIILSPLYVLYVHIMEIEQEWESQQKIKCHMSVESNHHSHTQEKAQAESTSVA